MEVPTAFPNWLAVFASVWLGKAPREPLFPFIFSLTGANQLKLWTDLKFSTCNIHASQPRPKKLQRMMHATTPVNVQDKGITGACLRYQLECVKICRQRVLSEDPTPEYPIGTILEETGLKL